MGEGMRDTPPPKILNPILGPRPRRGGSIGTTDLNSLIWPCDFFFNSQPFVKSSTKVGS